MDQVVQTVLDAHVHSLQEQPHVRDAVGQRLLCSHTSTVRLRCTEVFKKVIKYMALATHNYLRLFPPIWASSLNNAR